MNFDWNNLAFASKKPLRELNAVFIAAPRQISTERFKQLIKQYLPKSHIMLGVAKEPHVLGLENQDWFRTLQLDDVQAINDKVNQEGKHKIHTLEYFQRDLPYILEKVEFTHHVFINGSWYHAFHQRPEHYRLAQRKASYELVSPFIDEAEAKAYAQSLPSAPKLPAALLSEQQMLALAGDIASYSLAYSEFQTGVAIGRRQARGYKPLLATCNQVVPYPTYAMHHGASRERNFSPTNDLNHYDVNHAEVAAVVAAGRQKIDLKGTTLFINLLPCPTCARMFTITDIDEFVYTQDHSDGYAVRMLEAAGKRVRRLVL